VKLHLTCAVLTAMTLLTACAETTVSGDAGCASYGEARQSMPGDADQLPDNWLGWVASIDTRMTATCR
jgi:hypothetical protein